MDSKVSQRAVELLAAELLEGDIRNRVALAEHDDADAIPVDFALRAIEAALASPADTRTPSPDAVRQQIINAPETTDFMAGVPLEAAHQRDRWSVDHDAGKSPFDWFWLIGYLAQKAADAAVRGDVEKAKHHTISTGAALANWHAALTGADTGFQPGITPKPAEIVV